MSITRYGITDGAHGRPIISGMVVRDDTVYLCGITAEDPGGDITAQTQQVLARIDAALQKAGTDKSKLLTAQVWLADMHLFAAHNAVWNAWVDPQHPPVRACVRADLTRPEFLVEIMVTAAR